MPRPVTAAAVRLSNDPAPTEQRLQAAEAQVIQAAEQGAQLVVLPEVFNTGYVYRDENYALAETLDGPTVTWMKRVAAECGVHLAGSLLLRGAEHITNSLLLVAPDGRIWRYDKNFPWAWERLYFREGRDITVAKTDIGTFGLMICIDVAAPRLFKRYAGRVDALICCASPPRVHEAQVTFPDGGRITLGALMNLSPAERTIAGQVFGERLLGFTSWMGVPVVQSIPYGHFSSPIPVPWLSFGMLLVRKPSLWRYLPQGSKATLIASYFTDNLIADAHGNILACYDAEADGFALATIELADSPPTPGGSMPHTKVLPADAFSWLLIPFYRRGVRRVWGPHMAPVDAHTRVWIRLLIGTWLGGLVMGWLRGRRCRKRHTHT
jgi:hypothetical protein